jgi:hypothetical protein
MALSSPSGGIADRLGPRILLVWAGLSIGVAFLATPAKFLAPSLSLSAALDVGRHTFRIYNLVELGLLLGCLSLSVVSRARRGWYLALALPAAVVAAEALWLLPALDVRVSAILEGRRPLPASSLHTVYVAAEACKALWLLGFGFGDLLRGAPAAAPSGGAP